MTNREAYFSLIKLENKYLTKTVIKSVLTQMGGYTDFFALLNHFDDEIVDIELFNSYIERIKKGEPYQYVLERAFFVSSDYIVTPDVLIPRQETEQLAVGAYYYASKVFGKDAKINICDIGTGSGILAIYLKEKFKNAKVFATDISEKALEVANKNAKLHNVEIELYQGNMVDPLLEKSLKFDILVSNPPYIKDESTIDEQVWKYEPHTALLANPTTKFYEEIINNAHKLMKPNSLMAFEIGEDMEEALTKLIEEKLPDVLYAFEKDLYNKTRFLYVIMKEDLIEA